MLQHTSPDLLRACAQYAPDGRPTDRDRENFRQFQRQTAERKQATLPYGWADRTAALIERLSAFLRLRAGNT